MAHRDRSWMDRVAARDDRQSANDSDTRDREFSRQSFQRPHTSFGGAKHFDGTRHYIYMAGALAPLLIGELVPDPAKRWRWVRISSIATTLAYEALYTVRERQRHSEQEAKLARCRQAAEAAR